MRSFIWIVTVEQPRPLTLLTEHMPRKDRTQIFTSLKTPDPFSLSLVPILSGKANHEKKGTEIFFFFLALQRGQEGFLPSGVFGEHCLSGEVSFHLGASCAAAGGKKRFAGYPLGATLGQKWFWVLLPKQKDLGCRADPAKEEAPGWGVHTT